MEMRITGANTLLDDRFEVAPVHISPTDGVISDVGSDRSVGRTIGADGLHLLPGVVDMHGDAFERRVRPRPGVHVALDVALADSDRQAVANGITTVFHGVTWSWEPGLRCGENAEKLLEAIEALRPKLATAS